MISRIGEERCGRGRPRSMKRIENRSSAILSALFPFAKGEELEMGFSILEIQ